MTAAAEDGLLAWLDAELAAAVFAVDPHGFGGVWVRAGAGPVRDLWLGRLKARMPAGAPIRRLPPRSDPGRLIGGLDVAATIDAGSPVIETGLLAAVDGGALIAPMAERLESGVAAIIAGALDAGAIAIERDGVSRTPAPARFGLIALDESAADEPGLAPVMSDRMTLVANLQDVVFSAARELPKLDAEVSAARLIHPQTSCSDPMVDAIAATAESFGVSSVRVLMGAVRAARAIASLEGRNSVEAEDAARACRLVLGPRATTMPESQSAEENTPGEDRPAPEQAPTERQSPPDGSESGSPAEEETPAEISSADLEAMMIAATRSAISSGVLARIRAGAMRGRMSAGAGRAGAKLQSSVRGRPRGTRAGTPGRDGRLDVLATLRAAIPWRRLRTSRAATRAIEVRRSDFRVKVFDQPRRTVAIFVVDASGSSAFNRLGEAKGAIELLLADCYVRRDEVALVAFRRNRAEVALAPTRALARAKRALAEMAGGGATPLASGVALAADLAADATRRGVSPLLVFLTDGGANIALDGVPGRPRAEADALETAARIRLAGWPSLLFDTGARPDPRAARLGAALGAIYAPLPFARSQTISDIVRTQMKSI